MARVRGAESVQQVGGLGFQPTRVGTARQAPVRLERLVGDHTDSATSEKVQQATANAFSTATKIGIDIQKKDDARAKRQIKIGLQAEMNDLLFNKETGIKTKGGSEALGLMDGSARMGGEKGQSALEIFKARGMAQIGERGSGMSNLARQDMELFLEEEALKLDGQLGPYRVQQQNVADTQMNKVRKAQALERVQQAPGNGQNILDAQADILEVLFDPEVGDLALVGIKTNGKKAVKEEDQPLVDKAVQDAMSLVRYTSIDALIRAGHTGAAQKMFDASEKHLNGPDKVKLREALQKNTDKDAALAQWKTVVAQATTKDGTFVPTKARELINKETDAGKRTAMITALNSKMTFDEKIKDAAEATADHAIREHLFANGSVEDIPPELVSAASQKMMLAVLSGDIQAAQTKNLQTRSDNAALDAHVAAGGRRVSVDGYVDQMKNRALDDPQAFLRETADAKIMRGMTDLNDFNDMVSLRVRITRDEQQRLIEKAKGVNFRTVQNTLKEMGYSTSSKTYELLESDVGLQGLLQDKQVEWYTNNEGKGDMPIGLVREALTPALVEVMTKDRFTVGQGGARITPIGAGGDREVFFKSFGSEATFRNLLAQKPDVSKPDDIERLTLAIGLQRRNVEAVQDAVDKLVNTGDNDNPTTFQIVAELAKDAYPVMLKGEAAEKGMIAASTTGKDPRFLAFWLQNRPEALPFTAANVVRASNAMDAYLLSKPHMMQKIRSKFARSLSQ